LNLAQLLAQDVLALAAAQRFLRLLADLLRQAQHLDLLGEFARRAQHQGADRPPCFGRRSTLSASIEQMIYHGGSVRRGADRTPVVVDMPFLSYQVSIEEAIRHCGRVMAATDCDGVKLEGGAPIAATIHAVVERGIPVIGHLGFTPQSVHGLGGPRVQGRDARSAAQLLADARALEDAGASAVVLELVPRHVAAEITAALTIPTIGIGAGPDCDGQVLVLHDMLGLNEGFSPRFLRRYAELGGAVRDAVGRYADDVRRGTYPDDEHSFD